MLYAVVRRGRLRPREDAARSSRPRSRRRGSSLLNWADAGWVHFFTKTPVTTPDDLKPLKLFAWAGDTDYSRSGRTPASTRCRSRRPRSRRPSRPGSSTALPTTPQAAVLLQWYNHAKNMTDVKWALLLGGDGDREDDLGQDLPPSARSACRDAAARGGRAAPARRARSVGAAGRRGDEEARPQRRRRRREAPRPSGARPPRRPTRRSAARSSREAAFDEALKILADYRRSRRRPREVTAGVRFRRAEEGLLVGALAVATVLPLVDAFGRPLGGFHIPGSAGYVHQLVTLWTRLRRRPPRDPRGQAPDPLDRRAAPERARRRVAQAPRRSPWRRPSAPSWPGRASASCRADREQGKILPFGLPEWVGETIMPVALAADGAGGSPGWRRPARRGGRSPSRRSRPRRSCSPPRPRRPPRSLVVPLARGHRRRGAPRGARLRRDGGASPALFFWKDADPGRGRLGRGLPAHRLADASRDPAPDGRRLHPRGERGARDGSSASSARSSAGCRAASRSWSRRSARSSRPSPAGRASRSSRSAGSSIRSCSRTATRRASRSASSPPSGAWGSSSRRPSRSSSTASSPSVPADAALPRRPAPRPPPRGPRRRLRHPAVGCARAAGRKRPPFSCASCSVSSWEAKWELALPLLVIGLFASGFASMVEASAAACAYAVVVAVLHHARHPPFRDASRRAREGRRAHGRRPAPPLGRDGADELPRRRPGPDRRSSRG